MRLIEENILPVCEEICSRLNQLGHAELTTTNIYAHTTTDVREIVGKLDSVRISASIRKQEGAVIEEVL